MNKAVRKLGLLARAVGFLGLFITTFSRANACSLQMPYPQETYSSFEKFTEEGHFIAVVKVQRKPKIKKKTKSQFRPKFETNNLWSDLWLLELEIIENLSGAGPYFSNYLKMSKRFSSTFLDTETSYMNTEKGFDFWDKFDVSNPYMKGYQLGMGCNLPYPILRENHYYLALGQTHEWSEKNSIVNQPMYFEPIKNLSDPFIGQLRNAVLDTKKSPLTISAHDYFRNMKGYAEIELKSCNSDDYEYRLSRRIEGYERNSPLAATIIEYFGVDTTDIYLADSLHSFRTRDVEKISPYTCRVGDRFLVIYRPVLPNPRHDYGVMKNRNTSLQYRYLPIIENTVETSKVMTNFDIQGDAFLAVEDVKNWIKSGENRDH